MPAARPVAYRLTPRARADLEDIWLYTAERWSPDQADGYLTELAIIFDLLLVMPEIARERTEFDPPIRLHPHRARLIVYRIEDDHLLIVGVPHRRENWTFLIDEAG